MLQPLIIPCSLPPRAAAWRHLPHAPAAGLPGRASAWPARAAPAPRRHPAARPGPQTRPARWCPWRQAGCRPRGAPTVARAQRGRAPPRGLALLRRPPGAHTLSLQGLQALRARWATGARPPGRMRQRRALPAQCRPPRRAQAPARSAAARARARRRAAPRYPSGPRRRRRRRPAAAGMHSACPARTAGAVRRRSRGGCPRGRPAPAAPATQLRRTGPASPHGVGHATVVCGPPSRPSTAGGADRKARAHSQNKNSVLSALVSHTPFPDRLFARPLGACGAWATCALPFRGHLAIALGTRPQSAGKRRPTQLQRGRAASQAAM